MTKSFDGRTRVLPPALLLLWIPSLFSASAAQEAECPPSELIPGCPCYNFEDGLFLECAGASEDTLRTTLQGVMNSAGTRLLIFLLF